MKIGILTDSTADIDADIINKYDIEVVPLTIHFGNNVFRDGIDLDSDSFFKKLKNTDKIPGTSRVPVASFVKKYKNMAEKYDTIISIHLSSALSGTLESAKIASQQLPDINIHPINSGTISLGLGFLILLTARLIENDCSLSQILSLIKKAKENLFLYFTVSDLKYLEQGGRIGKARAFLGSIFNINPIISLDTGTGHVLPLEKSRGKSKTRKRMVAIGLEKLQNKKFAWIGFAHGDRKKDNNKFKESLLTAVENNLNLTLEVFTSRINATLGCHVGPSVYAGVIMTGDFLNL